MSIDFAAEIRNLFFGNNDCIISEVFPQKVWILYSGRDKYCTMRLTKKTLVNFEDFDENQYGLICFSSESIAWQFCHILRTEKNEICCPIEKSFNEARKIAQDRPNCSALVLFDNPDAPEIHWVK